MRGRGAASRWLTRAGLGEFKGGWGKGPRMMQQRKRQPKLPFLRGETCPAYFFALRWANLLRNFSTRPPSESTLF